MNATYKMPVPAGQTYKFRAIHLGLPFWSDPFQDCTSLPCPPVKVEVADATVRAVRMDGGIERPVPAGTGLAAYADGTHKSSATGDGTTFTFKMPVPPLPADKKYKFRALHLGRVFWSEEFQLCTALPSHPFRCSSATFS
jgi:hypothetical protein